MNKTVKTVALLSILGLTAVSCQKDKTSNGVLSDKNRNGCS